MAYSPTTWVDDSSPPINAANLNKIEQGIVTADRSEVFAQTSEPAVAIVALWADTTNPQTPGAGGGGGGGGGSSAIDMLNALDYGAKGDGTTDDTAALQSCIDAAAAAGKIAYVPKGNYKVIVASRSVGYGGGTDTYGLFLPSNTRLVGDGPGPLTFLSQDGGTVFGHPNLGAASTQPAEFDGITKIFTTSTSGSIITSINTRRVTVERLAVSGPGRAGNTLNAVKFGYTTDSTAPISNSVPFYINCDDVWVSNVGGDGFRNQTVCVSSFRNCIASDIGGTGFNHPEGSAGVTYQSCWSRACLVGWHFQGSAYVSLNGCAADYCSTSYWASDCQTIGWYGCGSEFPYDAGSGNNRGYSWVLDQNTNSCTLSSCEVIGSPYRAIWVTGGASMNTFSSIAENGPLGTAQYCLVADAGTHTTLINLRNDKANLIDAAAVVNILEDGGGSITAGRDVNVNRDVVVKGGNLFLQPQTAGTIPFLNAGRAVLSSKVTYDDSGSGALSTGMLSLSVDASTARHVVVKSYVDARTPKITVGTTAPSSPAVGDLWVDTN